MPLITIHTSSKEHISKISTIMEELHHFASQELSCGDRTLDPNEISIRVIKSDSAKPIAQIEVMITAFSYEERVIKAWSWQRICLASVI